MEDGDLSTPAVKVVGFEVTSEETTAQEGPAQQASPPQPIFALDAEGGSAKVGPGADPSAPEEASQEAQGAAPAQASDPAVGTEETSTLAEEAPVEEDPLVHGNYEVKQALLQAEGVISEAVKDAIAVPEADPNAALEADEPAERAEAESSGPVDQDQAPDAPEDKAADPPIVSQQHDAPHLSLRSPVMILPQTESMTHSPMHGKERRAVDSLFLGPSTSEAPEGQKPLKGKKLSLDEAAAMRGDATEDLAAKGAREDKPSGAEGGAGSKREDGAARGMESIERGVQKLTVGSPPAAPEPQGAAGAASAVEGSREAGQQPQTSADEPPKNSAKLDPSPASQQPDAALTQKEKKEKRKQQVQFVKKDKPKLTKAERRALQEKQRAAKAALKAEQGKDGGGGGGSGKKADKPAASLSRPRSGPQSEFDNEKRVQRQKRKSLVPRETQEKSVELFSHLPQFDNSTLHESFQSLLSSGLHPEVVKLGRAYADLSISGGNARCLAMLAIFKLVIQDYNTPAGKSLTRDLTNHINVIIQFLIDCRPLAVSMGNAIRHFKTRIGSIHPGTPDLEAKKILVETIDQYIQDKILDASDLIADVASHKIQEGDVILTFAFSSSVLKTIQRAHQRGCRFRVIVVDSRPHFEGKKLVSRLADAGVSCTYAYITSLSYIMPQVTSVFLGAASALANGTVVSRVGSASVAVTASAFNIPVVVCCETYKFSHRVQLDAITHNELGDPDALAEVKGRPDVTSLQNWSALPNLRLLNLRYDAVAERHITMIATEVGMIPPSSVPVILREIYEVM